jgi:hypothetical protein
MPSPCRFPARTGRHDCSLLRRCSHRIKFSRCGNHTYPSSFKRGLTLTLAQEFREARDWFAQHKRDPFLWLVILGPLTFAAITFWGYVVFPPSGAIRAINQVLPNIEVMVEPRNFPKCSGQTYIFGYDFGTPTWDTRVDPRSGRVCRDIINGGWVVDIYPGGKISE